MNLLLVFEIIVILVASLLSFRILRQTSADNLIGAGVRVAALLLGFVAAFVSYRMLGMAFDAGVLNVVISAMVSSIVIMVVSASLRHRSIKRYWGQRLANRMRLPKPVQLFTNVLLVAAMWVGILFASLVTAELLAFSPRGRQVMRTSLAMRFLFDEHLEPLTPIAHDDSQRLETVRQFQLDQAEWYAQFASGIQRIKQEIY